MFTVIWCALLLKEHYLLSQDQWDSWSHTIDSSRSCSLCGSEPATGWGCLETQVLFSSLFCWNCLAHPCCLSGSSRTSLEPALKPAIPSTEGPFPSPSPSVFSPANDKKKKNICSYNLLKCYIKLYTWSVFTFFAWLSVTVLASIYIQLPQKKKKKDHNVSQVAVNSVYSHRSWMGMSWWTVIADICVWE